MFKNKIQLLPLVVTVIFMFQGMNLLVAQDDYFPNETVWTTISYSWGSLQPAVYTAVCGDTTINNVSYKKVYSLRESTNGGYIKTYDYAIRESEQKVWKLKEDTEELFYDFGLVEGDTFPVMQGSLPLNLIVESVSYEMIHGMQRKKIKFGNVNFFPGETWYEGIGSNRGFSNRGTGYMTDGSNTLCCVKIDNQLMYPNSPITNCNCEIGSISDLGLNCSLTTSTKNDISHIETVQIYPNPANGFVTIHANSDEIRQMEIYTVSGKLVSAKSIQQNETLNLTALNKGVYFVKIIEMNTNQFQIKKLVLN